MLELGKELTEEKYKELVKGTILSHISLSEIVDIAINLDKFWEFAGTYYKLGAESPIIIIDREQSIGGYNNSELTLSIVRDFIFSNDKNFQALVNETITVKSKMPEINENNEDILSK